MFISIVLEGTIILGHQDIGLISSHKAGQGQDPSAVVYWALLSDMALILMKKFFRKMIWISSSKTKNKSTRLAPRLQSLVAWFDPTWLLFLSELWTFWSISRFDPMYLDTLHDFQNGDVPKKSSSPLDVAASLLTKPRHFSYVDQGWELKEQTIGMT